MSTSNTTSTDPTRSRSRDDRASEPELWALFIVGLVAFAGWLLCLVIADVIGWIRALLRGDFFAAWRGDMEGRQ